MARYLHRVDLSGGGWFEVDVEYDDHTSPADRAFIEDVKRQFAEFEESRRSQANDPAVPPDSAT